MEWRSFFVRWAGFAALALAMSGINLAADSHATSGHRNHRLRDVEKMEGEVREDTLALNHSSSSSSARRQEQLELHGSLESLAFALSNVEDEKGAIQAMNESLRLFEEANGIEVIGNENADLAAIDQSHAEDAVKAIALAARSRQIVILNEAHHVPFDRVLAMHLARALRKEGFEYLACETFTIDDTHVMKDGYVSEKTGVYSSEPTYAKFLLDAQEEGWKFVSYEPSGMSRESGMAKNLIDRILKAHPKARIFIYAGYDHARKVPASTADDDDSMLAAQLRRLTGINPLTVNQTTLFAHYDTSQQLRYYQHAARKLVGRNPVVLIGANGMPVQLSLSRFAYDFEVVHPDYVDDPSTERSEWLSREFVPIDIPREMVPTRTQRLIYAYPKGAGADAVPLDVIMLGPGQRVPKFMLPPGDYEFEFEDGSTARLGTTFNRVGPQ